MPDYIHLHNHSQFSLLDGASDISKMMDKALADGQRGVALTDHGNMFGAFKFVSEANKRNLKPIVGCEFYLVADRHRKSFSRAAGDQDMRYHQLLLAKNQTGYENLSKLCSLGFTEGMYSKYPRIDKEVLLQHHEGLIATSCCLGAEIPQAILHGDLQKAETLVKWWLDVFGEDFYIELQRHRGLENIDGTGVSQEDINQQLILCAKKFGIRTIATNDSHYLEESDWSPHDVLLCINTNTPIKEENRFKFPSQDFFFKTKDEMNALFGDVPEALDHTLEIFGKVDTLDLARDILLPAFPLPAGFADQDAYLRHLTFEGAKKRYGSLTPLIEERLNFELQVISQSGYPGYFLIVADFTTTARKLGVSVGPGRGSAAGSAVAYCTGITNVDPIKYDLLFERFLNPERVSMPDIDIDFDDEGRQRVIDYVIEKYGQNQVAQIVTYGTMAAKMSLRDVGRVMEIPLSDVDRVAKSFPSHLKATLNAVLADQDVDKKLKKELNAEDTDKAYKFRALAEGGDELADMINTARKLEGSVRNTGIHACGIVITPDEITRYVPVKMDVETGMLVTQFDNSVAEDAGLLKMDFLGLKTLTIIKNAVSMIRKNRGIDLDMDDVPLDDEATYQLFQRGDTVGIFQYESPGMQRHMKDLVPTKFEDLIAMNALYRPGPMEYIPNFIARKHGREPITYDLPEMEEYLKDTYGITVYQEQVMLLSQKLAGFTKGQADMLRKAMGKKKKALIDELYPKFISGGEALGHPKNILDKIWKDWEAFASYAFNKSHSTCYAFVAFQTAWLKANYPAEFMASVLTNNKNDISKITFFLRECTRMRLDVLGPSVNESASDFSVNQKGQIRFGLSALKGVGEGPVTALLDERQENGQFTSIFDLVRRVNVRAINKKVLESLTLGGAFDCFEGLHRAQFFQPSEKYDTFLEHVTKYGLAVQATKEQAQQSLFGDTDEILIPEPDFPDCAPWSLIHTLEQEKQVTGIYISGHPLDEYHHEIDHLTNCSLELIDQRRGQSVAVAGIVTSSSHRISKKGTGWGIFTIQDYTGSLEFPLFSEDYQKFKHLLEEGEIVFIKGTYQQRWGQDGEFQLKVAEVRQMASASADMVNALTLRIGIDQITPELIEQIEKACSASNGPHKLKMVLLDQSHQISLNLVSESVTVQADTELVSSLESLGLSCTLS
jgi:DNA polymerase-3 subunit alpha